MISDKFLISFVMFFSILSALLPGSIALSQSQSLPMEPLVIESTRGTFEFQVEIADEPNERTVGLMNRTSMPPKAGMLFAFEEPQIINMWMQNTYISLDMIFADADGVVKTIVERTEPHSTAIITSRVDVSYVLELNAGMSALIGLQVGDKLRHRLFNNVQ